MLYGCGAFHETRYLATVHQSDPSKAVNFFRVEISGHSFLSSARFMSDFFDESALDSYFGTYVQPDDAKLGDGGTTADGETDSPTTRETGDDASETVTRGGGGTELVGIGGEAERGKQFILLLSTNADAFADAIGSIAQSETIAKDLVRLANKEKYQQAGELGASASEAQATSKQIVAAGTALIETADPAKIAEARQRILAFANQLTTLTGRGTPFKTVGDLKTIPPRQEDRP